MYKPLIPKSIKKMTIIFMTDWIFWLGKEVGGGDT